MSMRPDDGFLGDLRYEHTLTAAGFITLAAPLAFGLPPEIGATLREESKTWPHPWPRVTVPSHAELARYNNDAYREEVLP
ncbi:hypothetical protein TUSST3_14620 [Streptomyces sp. TUS-ST3]|nr:hypothetical protein TUSST3_14620 [Streptomyces sp. TUS-ST3]